MHADLVAADAAGDPTVQDTLVTEWQARLQRLLTTHTELADELRRLLDEQLLLAARATGRSWAGNVERQATARGQGRVYQVGQGSQHITDQ